MKFQLWIFNEKLDSINDLLEKSTNKQKEIALRLPSGADHAEERKKKHLWMKKTNRNSKRSLQMWSKVIQSQANHDHDDHLSEETSLTQKFMMMLYANRDVNIWIAQQSKYLLIHLESIRLQSRIHARKKNAPRHTQLYSAKWTRWAKARWIFRTDKMLRKIVHFCCFFLRHRSSRQLLDFALLIRLISKLPVHKQSNYETHRFLSASSSSLSWR